MGLVATDLRSFQVVFSSPFRGCGGKRGEAKKWNSQLQAGYVKTLSWVHSALTICWLFGRTSWTISPRRRTWRLCPGCTSATQRMQISSPGWTTPHCRWPYWAHALQSCQCYNAWCLVMLVFWVTWKIITKSCYYKYISPLSKPSRCSGCLSRPEEIQWQDPSSSRRIECWAKKLCQMTCWAEHQKMVLFFPIWN